MCLDLKNYWLYELVNIIFSCLIKLFKQSKFLNDGGNSFQILEPCTFNDLRPSYVVLAVGTNSVCVVTSFWMFTNLDLVL